MQHLLAYVSGVMVNRRSVLPPFTTAVLLVGLCCAGTTPWTNSTACQKLQELDCTSTILYRNSNNPRVIRDDARLSNCTAVIQVLLQVDAGTDYGFYGPKTEAAVRAFQTASSIKADGIAGPATWARLATLCEPTSSTTPLVGKGPLVGIVLAAVAAVAIIITFAALLIHRRRCKGCPACKLPSNTQHHYNSDSVGLEPQQGPSNPCLPDASSSTSTATWWLPCVSYDTRLATDTCMGYTTHTATAQKGNDSSSSLLKITTPPTGSSVDKVQQPQRYWQQGQQHTIVQMPRGTATCDDLATPADNLSSPFARHGYQVETLCSGKSRAALSLLPLPPSGQPKHDAAVPSVQSAAAAAQQEAWHENMPVGPGVVSLGPFGGMASELLGGSFGATAAARADWQSGSSDSRPGGSTTGMHHLLHACSPTCSCIGSLHPVVCLLY
jgi:hypothetical protein